MTRKRFSVLWFSQYTAGNGLHYIKLVKWSAGQPDPSWGLFLWQFLLPAFVKTIFSGGGNNSLRGFRSRSVGPELTHQPKRKLSSWLGSGDIKLELNTELRGQIIQHCAWAVFVDAGNVWLYHCDTSVAAVLKNWLLMLVLVFVLMYHFLCCG